MGVQLTLRLPGELAMELDLAAKRQHRKRSEIIRLALEQYLGMEVNSRPIDRVRDLLGRVESGVPDLGLRHREYVIRRLKDGR